MLIKDFINNDIPSLRLHDTVARALDLMETNRLLQLPLVDEEEFVGMMDEFHLAEYDDDTKIAEIPPLETPYLTGNQHLFEAFSKMNEHIEMLPVLDENKLFVGVVTLQDVLKQLSIALGMQERGAIIIVSLPSRDYSLAEISRLVESNGVKILSSYLSGQSNDPLNPMQLTLKLNQEDIGTVVATLERFGYDVEAAFANQAIQSVEQERYDLLMKYLNI
jgi:acetoin utilization protein AcuB